MSSDKKDEKSPESILSEARSALRKAEDEKYTKLIAAFMQSHSDDFLVAAKRGQRFIVVDRLEFAVAFRLDPSADTGFSRVRDIFQEMGCDVVRAQSPSESVMLFYAEM